VVALILCIIGVSSAGDRCTSPIYCEGPFLARMQNARVTNDSKAFVDMPLKAPVAEVLAAFALLPANSSTAVYKSFIDKWMYPAGYEVYTVMPSDWVERPRFVDELPSSLQPFGLSLHSKWKSLIRSFNHTGLCDGCYSSLHVPHPFVVAGGRFTEFYYWDSYWALQGLLVSEMTMTARRVVDNLLYMVDTYGFVPNGGRMYYLNRSQPPVLALMVKLLFEHTGDVAWLARALPTLDKEYTWWQEMRSLIYTGVNGRQYMVQRYMADTWLPRPESYREDVVTASFLPPKERQGCFRDLASGAETGWDFSSRWLRDWNQLSTIRTSSILPVDLNSILFVVEKSLSQLFAITRNTSRSDYYHNQAGIRASALHQIFWNEYALSWSDIIIASPVTGNTFYVSNFMPIWANAYHQSKQQALQIIQRVWPKIFFSGGIPTSLIQSGQQWDFPNAWAPLQQFMIDALDGLEMPEATKLADQLSIAWFNSNYCAWESTLKEGGRFFEKYDVTHPGQAGGGGEYEVQSGFGWTNGVLLKLLNTRSHLFQIPDCTKL